MTKRRSASRCSLRASGPLAMQRSSPGHPNSTFAPPAAPPRQFDITARARCPPASPSCAPRSRHTSRSDRARSSGSPASSAIVKDLDEQADRAASPLATAPEAVTARGRRVGALQDFEQMDSRARDYTRGRQLTLASDLVFTDGFDLTKKAGDADRARGDG